MAGWHGHRAAQDCKSIAACPVLNLFEQHPAKPLPPVAALNGNAEDEHPAGGGIPLPVAVNALGQKQTDGLSALRLGTHPLNPKGHESSLLILRRLFGSWGHLAHILPKQR